MIYRRCVLFSMRGLFSRLKGVSPSKSPAQPGRSLRSPIGHQSLTDVLPCGYFRSGFLRLPALWCHLRASWSMWSVYVYIPCHTSQIGRCYIPWSRGLIIVLLTPFFHIGEKTKMYFLKDIINMLSEKKVSKKSPSKTNISSVLEQIGLLSRVQVSICSLKPLTIFDFFRDR